MHFRKYLNKKFIISLTIILLMILTILIIPVLFSGCAEESAQTPDSKSKAADDSKVTESPGSNNSDDELKDPDDAETNDESNSAKIEENEENIGENIVYTDGFEFIYNGVSVYMGEYIANILSGLGTESDFYESDSCTSDGMMKTYVYGGFEISTYAINEADEHRIFSVAFHDDSISTAEGIYIGQTVDEMTAKYGSDYETMPGYYRYTKNGTALSFDVDGDTIISITYQLLNI